MLAPHVRILGGGKTIEEPCVHFLVHRIIKLIGQIIDVAEPQIQRDAPAVQQQTMATAEVRRPLRLKLLRPWRKFRPVLMGETKVMRGERKFFKTDEM